MKADIASYLVWGPAQNARPMDGNTAPEPTKLMGISQFSSTFPLLPNQPLEPRRPATHAIIGCFGQCSHSAAVNLEPLEPKMTIPELHQRLRCTKRGAKEANIRIAYIAAGGYRHS